jgi:regulator of sirC expression with transglutaminase-like and TPR domain
VTLQAPAPQLDYFAALVRDDAHLPLTEAAFAVAQGAYPALDVQTELIKLDELAAPLVRAIPKDAPPAYRLRALRQYFFQELGFKGNRERYYEPANSYLNKVLEQRQGIPISLAVLFMEVAHQAGLKVEGISFPGHFLMKVPAQNGLMHEVIIDPFTGGAESRESVEKRMLHQPANPADALTVALYLQSATSRDVLARMLRNLQGIYRHLESWRNLLAVQQRIVILLPGDMTAVRDRGYSYVRVGEFEQAREDLQAYLDAKPFADDAGDVQEQLGLLQ